ncbi:MAG: alpha/beta hydrolase, partial [Planctomycetota bacterium]
MKAEDDRSETSFAHLPPECPPPQCTSLILGDGYDTSVYVHESHGEVNRLPVVYLHGIQSHPGWFARSAAMLAKRGHTVFQVTRRGSGDNRTLRGHARSAGQLLEDVETALDFATSEVGSSRIHLVGISWGGKLATCFALDPQYRERLASLTLIAPGIAPRVNIAITTRLAVGLSLLICPKRRFDIPLNDVALFTDNEQMREYLRCDPLRL